MSDGPRDGWSTSPANAPKVLHFALALERHVFAVIFICSILYGTLVVLFFQCMTPLLDPVHRRGEGIKWGLVSYTVTTFSFATVYATNLNIQSISLINNREFSGGPLFGPTPYTTIMITPTVLGLTPNIMFALNNWLADGLLLYRCYTIYSTNLWVIALPCLMYLAPIAAGIITLVDQARGEHIDWVSVAVHFGLPYLSISVSLNVLLTIMIAALLVLHIRDVRIILGALGGIRGLYKAITTMLVESCALFTINSLLVIGLSVAGNDTVNTFLPFLAGTQIIAPLLIVQRVANKSVLTSCTIAPGSTGTLSTMTRGESTGTIGIPPGGYLMSSADKYGNFSDQFGVGAETTINLHRDSET